MKIEKVNDNQLRCFITKEELAARKMKISELAYGTEKARGLFREMMKFASTNFGFESDDLPLMIEAIPLSQDIMLLTVTKIAYPDELDSRFAYFSDTDFAESLSQSSAYAPGLMFSDDFNLPMHGDASDIIKSYSEKEPEDRVLSRHFVFKDLDSVINVAKHLDGTYKASNSLYKDKCGDYHLILDIGMHTPEEFTRVCNFLCEYGQIQDPESGSHVKLAEHGTLISKPDAIGSLSLL